MSLRSMKSPLGRPNCFHWSRNFPSWSKIWMRLLLRSPTKIRPLESIAIACGVSNSLGPEPFLPHALMNFPSFENFTMRALESPPCPSATKMSPFGAVTTSLGRLNVSGPSPATPALPSVISTFPSGLNLNTWWPLPSLPVASLAQTLPSRSTWKPCGWVNIPSPNIFKTLPEGSSLMIGAKLDPVQLVPPHRSNTQMLPSRSISTPIVPPHFLPPGSVPQPSSMRYGFSCAYVPVPGNGTIATSTAARLNIMQPALEHHGYLL